MPAQHPNILHIDIDSLRPDHLGCYGYHRATSPVIDSVAKKGLRFTGVHSSDVPCHPSRTALWSGRFGRVTGVVGHGGSACEPFPEGSARAWAGTFYEDGFLKQLRDLGYHTTTFSSFAERHGSWHWYAGFNEVHNCGKRGMEQAQDVVPGVLDWIDQDRKVPWYLHVNLWDPHTPYRTPESFGDPFVNDPLPAWLTEDVIASHVAGYGPHSALEPNGYGYEEMSHYPRAPYPIDTLSKAAAWINGYDTGLLNADRHIGLVLEALRAQGLDQNTIVIISADHGENLGELNVWADHQTADRHTANVPLIIHWPGNPLFSGVDTGLRYHFDWAATLLEALGSQIPSNWSGKSFLSDLADERTEGRDFLILSQGAWAAQHGVLFRKENIEWLLLRTYHDGYKDMPPELLFDLTNDPHETKDLAQTRPDLVAHAKTILGDWSVEQEQLADGAPDPLQTVIAEGGPFHCKGELGSYLEHLRATGRAHHARSLAERHPDEVTLKNAGNIAIQ